jgi:hypothetical protein
VLERDLLMSKYIEQVGADMRAEVAGHLLTPNADGLSQPTISDGDDVRAGIALASQSIPTLAGATKGEDLLGRANDIHGEVVHAQGRGKDKIERNRQVREADTASAERQPGKDGAEQAREWSRSVPLSPVIRD